MKLGILGTGMIVQELLPVLAEMGCPPVAVLATERSFERAGILAEKHGVHFVYCRYEELLAGETDTVYIALPNHLHYGFAREALLHGKHVIVEKPIVTAYSEFYELCQLARQRGLVLAEAMTVPFMPAFQHLKEDLAWVGRIRMMNLNYSQYSSRYDAFQRGETPPVFDSGKAGGALLDINGYNLYFAVSLLGRPQSVHYFANVQRDVDTSGVAVLDYGETKAVCIGAKDCKSPNHSTIQGELGTITLMQPTGQLCSYEVDLVHGKKETVCIDRTPHRLFCEWKELLRIVDGKDFHTAEALLEVSGNTVWALEQARRTAGLGAASQNQEGRK